MSGLFGVNVIGPDSVLIDVMRVNMLAKSSKFINILIDVVGAGSRLLHVIVIRNFSIWLNVRTATKDKAHLLLVVITDVMDTVGVDSVKLVQQMKHLINIPQDTAGRCGRKGAVPMF
jgi:hypothetical protein